ncbi:MAG: UDP-N-acetylmuramoyl-L-alanine--D-glutamate ligase [Parcubacteria group bacterium]
MAIHTDLFRGKKVLIFGLGLHGGGVSSARYFAKHGSTVRVTDVRPRLLLLSSIRRIKKGSVSYVLGRHRTRDIDWADVLVKNPGVSWSSPYMEYARRKKKRIITDIGFFVEQVKAPVIGVTGTKGKSTTSALLAAFLRTRWRQLMLAGNALYSPLERIDTLSSKMPVVLELSSWQLEDAAYTRWSPHVAIVTNIYPDHLNRHKSMGEYIAAKELIVRFQSRGDILIANRENPYVKLIAKKSQAKLIWFSKKPFKTGDGVFLRNGMVVSRTGDSEREIIHSKFLRLKGRHNLEDALAAIAGALVYDIPKTAIHNVMKRFVGLPGRLETVRHLNGVTYVNDTTSTTPQAAIEALRTIHKPIQLIAGGSDKKLSFGKFCREIKLRSREVILLPGSGTMRMKKFLLRFGVKYHLANSMVEAVRLAKVHAEPGDTVLLSPGCASFGVFLHEFDRGDQFVREVAKFA